MTSNTNNNSDQVSADLYNEQYEELLYELLLYKKKDIIAIQEKLGMTPLGPINDITNQTALNESKGKILLKRFISAVLRFGGGISTDSTDNGGVQCAYPPYPFYITSKYTRSR